MRKVAQCFAVVSTALLAETAAAAQFTTYMTVNDEDYGYSEGPLIVRMDEKRTQLEELAGLVTESLVFELGHDLVQGLVRQYVPRLADSTAAMSMAVSEAADAAGAAASAQQIPVGENSWVRIGKFQTLGVGQYEGPDPTYGVYCDRSPSVWVWLAAASIEGLSPDDAANRVLKDENGMAWLKLACEGGLEVSK